MALRNETIEIEKLKEKKQKTKKKLITTKAQAFSTVAIAIEKIMKHFS